MSGRWSFGQMPKEPEHDARHSFIEAMLWKYREQSVGNWNERHPRFWLLGPRGTRRLRLRAKRLGASRVKVHFLDVPEESY